jgi:thioredoxin reductase
MSDACDVLVVGGGPAGLSAALSLARARKRVIVCDDGPPRNARSSGVHGYLGREGVLPSALREAGWEDLAKYPSVSRRTERIVDVSRRGAGFVASLASGGEIHARRVLLATGVVDLLPKTPGLAERWGRDVFDCPYCHGFEHADRPWGLVAPKVGALRQALSYLSWTRALTIFTEGPLDVPADVRRELDLAKVRLEVRKMTRLVVEGDALVGIEVEGGEVVPCGALVYHPSTRPSDLALMLGVAVDAGVVKTDGGRETSIKGIFAAGDLAGSGMKALLAAADGMHAAQSIAYGLTMEDVLRG